MVKKDKGKVRKTRAKNALKNKVESEDTKVPQEPESALVSPPPVPDAMRDLQAAVDKFNEVVANTDGISHEPIILGRSATAEEIPAPTAQEILPLEQREQQGERRSWRRWGIVQEVSPSSEQKQPDVMPTIETKVEPPKSKPTSNAPKVSKQITTRGIMMGVGIISITVGVLLFIIYIQTTNIFIGSVAVILAFGGFILFKFYLDKGAAIRVEHIGRTKKNFHPNCLNIYKDRVVFEEWPKDKGEPIGYPQECENDHKKYWVNISENNFGSDAPLKPFALPDQQTYDPQVFAERVIGLPAHRRLFQRREKAGQVIKTALMVVTVLILFILIIATTGKA